MNIDKNNKSMLFSAAVGICLFSQVLLAEVLYVDQRAIGLNNGSAWDQAFTDLQQALDMAQPGDEIRMATGVYTPAEPDGDPNATFLLASGAVVKGGYAGGGADDPNDWDVNAYPTVLSGDLNGNDGEDWSFREDNVFHVVTAVGTDANTVMEGLTIADGHAFEGDRAYIPWLDPNSRGFEGTEQSSGGGLLIRNTRPDEASVMTLKHCIFQDNTSLFGGAALFILHDSLVTIHQCDFVDNYGELGPGAIGRRGKNSETLLIRCNFYGNGSKSQASVIETISGGLTARHCRFSDNMCTLPSPSGSTLECRIGDVLLDNCLFSGNSHETIISSFFGKLNLVNCTVVGNEIVAYPGEGAAVESRGSDLRISNSIIWGNPLEPKPNVDPDVYDRYAHYQLCCIGDEGSFWVDHSLIESWLNNDEPGSMVPDPL
ncbi:MAG: right-handed parallel beta-helix repeat-containing protein, partial [Planctomycetes bacterium]|nr:right-handed parallel beta-helix repeat-containing protein [Planctomycetota bacterium]